MSLKNFYTGKRASGTVLTDLKGSNNGTFKSAGEPAIDSNGYLKFDGSNDYIYFSPGDYSYSFTDSFSIVLLLRTAKNDSNYRYAFAMRDASAYGYIAVAMSSAEKLELFTKSMIGLLNEYDSAQAENDGQWHICIITYDNAGQHDFYSDVKLASYQENNISSGIFYSSNSKPALGSRWNDAAGVYQYFWDGDIRELRNYNHKLSPAEASNLISYHKGFF